MGWLDELFGGGREQAGKDMYNQMQQGLGQYEGAFNPYISREPGLYQQYLDAINQGKDPNALLNQFMQNYRMSPEAQAQIAQGTQAANAAATASGMLGSGAEQTAAANRAQSVRTQDREAYLDRLFGIRNQYLGGIGGLQKEGFDASMNKAQGLLKYYEDMANAKAGQDTGRAGGISNAVGFLGKMAGNFLTGGASGAASSGLSWLDPDTGSPYQQR